jgi:hypothetical protein
MRTKHILLTAALVAAGVASSMAQSNVYSLNVVGYVNIPIRAGYNLLANQLDVDGTNNINTVLATGIPDGSTYLSWTGHGFSPYQPQFNVGTGWLDDNFNLATNSVPLGHAFFLFNPGTATNITLVGQVVQTTNSFPVQAGYGFYGVVPPIASDLDTNGFPFVDGASYLKFTASGYVTVGQLNGPANAPQWLDDNFNQVFPTPAVGEGFVVFNPGAAATWVQSFTVH